MTLFSETVLRMQSDKQNRSLDTVSFLDKLVTGMNCSRLFSMMCGKSVSFSTINESKSASDKSMFLYRGEVYIKTVFIF